VRLSCWDFGHSTTHQNNNDTNNENNTSGFSPQRRGKPVVLAPAMNTAMWEHPLTAQQLDQIRSFGTATTGVVVVPPQSKLLACGDTGVGALAEVDVIVQSVRDIMQEQQHH
jgi:phosphopantothenoylcysteine synthetase/decarboxylase